MSPIYSGNVGTFSVSLPKDLPRDVSRATLLGIEIRGGELGQSIPG